MIGFVVRWLIWFVYNHEEAITCTKKQIREDTDEMPQTRNTALPGHQK